MKKPAENGGLFHFNTIMDKPILNFWLLRSKLKQRMIKTDKSKPIIPYYAQKP